MKFNHTHSAILRGRWLVDKAWADAHMSVVFRMLNGEAVDFGGTKTMDDDDDQDQRKLPSTFVTAESSKVYSVRPSTDISMIPDEGIAVVTLAGPLLKRGDRCSYGMVDQAALISKLGKASNVSGIILSIDSPGGQADGTAMLADVIKNVSKSKPTVAVIDDGMAASAAMWVASAASEIFVTQPTDQVGSIGVYTTIADWNTHYKEYFKLQVSDIYAPQSTDKNKDYRDAINGDFTAVQEDLKVLADQFINTVATNRAGKIKGESWSTGKMFYAKDAMKIGLIDGIKSFDQVVSRMNNLISNKNSSSKAKNMAFEQTLNAAQATEFQVTEGGFLLSEENLNNIEAAIINANTGSNQLTETNQQLSAQVENLTAELSAAQQNVTSLTEKNAELQARVDAFDAAPSGGGTTLLVPKDAATEEAEVPFHLSDKNPANAYADKVLRHKKATS